MASDRLQRQIERLLNEADQAITEEDWSTVSSRARSVLAIDPENSDGLALLATADRALATPARITTSQAPTSAPAISAPTPDQPTSFADGRYQVNQCFAKVGVNRVYRVE